MGTTTQSVPRIRTGVDRILGEKAKRELPDRGEVVPPVPAEWTHPSIKMLVPVANVLASLTARVFGQRNYSGTKTVECLETRGGQACAPVLRRSPSLKNVDSRGKVQGSPI